MIKIFQYDLTIRMTQNILKLPFKIKTLFVYVYGQRKTIRRQDDRYKIYYLDRYSSTLFACIVSILLLSVIDALLTLYLIDHGAVELNPLMAYYLNSDPLVFMSIKYLLTSFLLLLSHSHP